MKPSIEGGVGDTGCLRVYLPLFTHMFGWFFGNSSSIFSWVWRPKQHMFDHHSFPWSYFEISIDIPHLRTNPNIIYIYCIYIYIYIHVFIRNIPGIFQDCTTIKSSLALNHWITPGHGKSETLPSLQGLSRGAPSIMALWNGSDSSIHGSGWSHGCNLIHYFVTHLSGQNENHTQNMWDE